MEPVNTYRGGPDEQGHFGVFGGRYVAETLMPLILDLEKAWNEAKSDPSFQAELDHWSTHYIGRPSPLYFAERLTEHLGGAKIYFKRDELNHTGAHKINNTVGQILLAQRMGKKTHHCRDRRRPARRGDGDRVCQSGVALRRLHGRGRYRAPGTQRLPYETPGRRCQAGHVRLAYPERRHERGAARLGDQCRLDLLHHRDGRRSPPLPRACARVPVGDRARRRASR